MTATNPETTEESANASPRSGPIPESPNDRPVAANPKNSFLPLPTAITKESKPLLMTALPPALPGCYHPSARLSEASRASLAPLPGPGIGFLRNRTPLRAKRTVWSGRIHQSGFHGAIGLQRVTR
jgi:hypothetical protein